MKMMNTLSPHLIVTVGALLLSPLLSIAVGQEEGEEGQVGQQIRERAPDAVHYRALWESSPFTRPLNAAESFAVTGVMRLDEKPIVTLLNTATGERFSLSTVANAQGWRLIELRDDANPRNVMAVVSINGEEVAVRFNDQQLAPDSLLRASDAPRQRANPPRPRGPGSNLNPRKPAPSLKKNSSSHSRKKKTPTK